MTAIAGDSTIATLARRWRDPAAWLATVDTFAILTAASLPWSTSLPAIFNAAMLAAMVPNFCTILSRFAAASATRSTRKLSTMVASASGSLARKSAWSSAHTTFIG